MALDLSTLSAEQQIAAIYIGYYDRAADPVGEDFWEGAVANPNLSLEDIATDFSTQAETQGVHPFFANPTADTANAFISTLYLNLFNRTPDQAGLDFWSDALLDAINDEPGAISVGAIILEIIKGAQNTEAGNDLNTILNKIEVATSWTDAAEAAGIDYTSDTGAQASAKSIIEGVTDMGSTVTAAKSTIADYFGETGGTEGDTFSFTSGTDNLSGTADNDTFEGYLQQNPFAGGVSNGLSSADRADGGAGTDRLYAELVSEFVGGVSGTENIDVQPRIKNIEILEFEARDIAQNAPFNIDIQDLAGNLLNKLGFDGLPADFPIIGGVPSEQLIAGILDGWQRDIVVDAKNITGHDFLGSTFSDGDLMIENVTTLTTAGVARNTSDITIGMNHTDNANSDGDASDLTVYFDEDYLISGQQAEGKIFYFLLDEDAELAGNPNRLNNIDVDGIRFTIDTGNGPVEVTIESAAANVAGTHQGFVNALQAPLQALIADGTLPAGTTLTLDPTVTDVTFLDDGSQSDTIPAMVLTSGDGSVVTAIGFSRIAEEIGEYDVYGRFNSINEVADEPVSINIDLYKAGRGGEGGNLVIGGKDQSYAGNGIEVFHVNVKGDGPDAVVNQPSNIGTLTSTNNALREIYIKTDAMDAVKDSVASLTIRDGFNELYDGDSAIGRESGDLQLVNADAFLGDLNLGTDQQIINLDTLTAQGGGDVFFNASLNGSETNQAYSYTTGGGDDTILVEIDGDALDYAGSSLNVSTGEGDDYVEIDSDISTCNGQNQQLNQNILDNVTVDTAGGNDTVSLQDDLNANVNTGAGNDVIYSGDEEGGEVWAMNFDAVRAIAQGGIGNSVAGNLPGEQVSLAYIGGASITVTLSGAGINGNLAAGGGVMAMDATGTNDLAPGATAGNDGYESTVTIGSLLNGNRYYGDQRDVNAAILKAINDDAVLSKLLVASIGANNTVVISSLVAGAFEDVDLRVDINQRDADSTSYADAVLGEAQSVFSNSALNLTTLWGTTTFATPASYQQSGPGADLSQTGGSAATDAWYDGLSEASDSANNAMSAAVGEGASNTHTNGTAATGESDSVFNGGNDDDVIVLSTDATVDARIDFTVSSNNALINGASNETVKMTGANFGDDTVMNFTTGSLIDGDAVPGDQIIGRLVASGDGVPAVVPSPETFVLDINPVPPSGAPYDIVFAGGTVAVLAGETPAQIAAKFVGNTYGNWLASAGASGEVVFTFNANGDQTPDVNINNFLAPNIFDQNATVTVTDGSSATAPGVNEFVIFEFDDEMLSTITDGVISITGTAPGPITQTFNVTVVDGDTAADIVAKIVALSGPDITVTSPAVNQVRLEATGALAGLDIDITATDLTITGTVPGGLVASPGVDFLDFTSYLTSQFDSSSGAPDSADSNILIPVTLDYSETNTLGGTGDGSGNADVEANEVAAVRMAGDAADSESFAGLTASTVATLFNNDGTFTGFGGDASFGNLNAGNFSVETYQKTDQEELIGNGKAIFMVENANNLGEYKVFELTWSGDQTSASGDTVTAVDLGSLDFGDSLTGLDDVNLVGSDDYAALLATGF